MPQSSRKRALLPLAVIAVGIISMLLLIRTRPSPEIAKPNERVWLVRAIKANPSENTPNLELYGKVESPRNSILTAAIVADVLEKRADEGDRVKKDQLLIVLDNRDAKLIYDQRLAEVKSLESQINAEMVRYESDKQAYEHEKELVRLSAREVKRRERLFESKTGSALELDNARRTLAQQKLSLTTRERAINDHENRLANLEAQKARAQALADQAKLDIDRSEVRAPFDGKVAKIFVAVGNRVRPGNQLIELFDNKTIEVRAQIPQRYTKNARDAVANKEKITAKAFVNNKTVEMLLDRLATKVELGRSGVDALFTVTKNADLLELGKTINIYVDLLPIANTTPVPTTALYGMNRVYKIVNSRLDGIEVEQLGNIIHPDGSQSILISSPKIKSGDLILTTHIPVAIDGLKVTVQNENNQ